MRVSHDASVLSEEANLVSSAGRAPVVALAHTRLIPVHKLIWRNWDSSPPEPSPGTEVGHESCAPEARDGIGQQISPPPSSSPGICQVTVMGRYGESIG
jgi:hypothetical protein